MNPTEPPPEKSNYSYKEMMDKLRRERQDSSTGRSSSEGGTSQPVRIEVVEDEHGNRVVAEVRRRRKRRSHQPKKIKEERIRRMRRFLVFGGIPLLVLAIGATLFMFSRVGGERFRTNASERVSELLGADVEFGRFNLSGLNLSSRKAVVKGRAGSLLREAELYSLKARIKLSSLISSDWDLGSVISSEGVLRFGPSTTSGSRDAGIGRVSAADSESPRMLKAGLGLDSAPGMIDITGIKVADASLYWDGRLPAAEPFVTGSGISTGELAGPSVGLSFRGGELAVPGWPDFKIGTLSGDVADGVYQIRRSSLEHVGQGRVSMTGTVELKGEGEYKMRAALEEISAREVVHPFWSDKFGGTLSGSVDISGALARPGSMIANGQFTARDLVLSNNMLQRLSTEIGESLLARIVFRTFSGRFRKTAEKLEFYDLEGTQDSLFRLRGGLTVHADGRFEGQLQIGIPDSVVQKMEGGKPAFFGIAEDGFTWTSVELGGLVDEPREDLTEKLRAVRLKYREESRRALPRPAPAPAPAPSTPAGGGGAPGEGLERTFEELIKPSSP